VTTRLRLACAALLAPLFGLGLFSPSAKAEVFRIGPVNGIMDFTLAYGLLARTQDRDLDFVGIANGGNARSVNLDDGNLNYDKGVVANEFRLSGDLTLSWRNFGVFVRGLGFYDFESELRDRKHSDLSDATKRRVGSGGELREYYLSAHFEPGGMPIQVRIGNQIINWGEGRFLRFGTDVVNPLDFVALLRPTAAARDEMVPQGMIWAASNVTELIAIEGFYQYDWEPVVEPPIGSFFSANDLIGGNGTNKYVTGFGEFSDLGTDLDAEFGLPTGTLGFDKNFMRVPSASRDEPGDHGQFGFTMQFLLPALNASSLSFHFINYHGRLPLISGIAADQTAIDDATRIGASNPTDAEATLALGTLSNETHWFAEYPEDIHMLGASFNCALPVLGTLVGIEASHHFNWPVQILSDIVIETALSPIRNALGGNPAGPISANQVISGIDQTHKTQLSLNLTQAFGPQLWSSRSVLSFDAGWVHFDGLAGNSLFDQDSWGYAIRGALIYSGVLGGISIRPFAGFTHDVSGVTPPPRGAFLEDRKSVVVGTSFNYINTITVDLTYVSFFDGKPLNAGVDRDFISFNIRYHF
jgi:hypothetical protein